MLGVALTAQRAGWQPSGPSNVNITVSMTNSSTLGYGIEQTPSFSWSNNDDYGTDTGYTTRMALGDMDLTGYTSVTGYDNNRWTFVITFAIDFPVGLTTNQGAKWDGRFRGNSGDGDFTGNFAWVCTDTGKLGLNMPGVNSVGLPEAYGNYNGRWLTMVASNSNTAASYSNWSAGSSGNYFQRLAVYETGTGSLLGKTDYVDTGRAGGFPLNFANWIGNAANTISTDRNDSFSYSINGLTGSEANCHISWTNFWFSFGTMFDPLTESDTSWRTTRPSQQIGNAQAWFNGQFTDFGNAANYVTAWTTVSSDDLYTDPDDKQMQLIRFDGNSTIWNNNYSTTNVPTWTG